MAVQKVPDCKYIETNPNRVPGENMLEFMGPYEQAATIKQAHRYLNNLALVKIKTSEGNLAAASEILNKIITMLTVLRQKSRHSKRMNQRMYNDELTNYLKNVLFAYIGNKDTLKIWAKNKANLCYINLASIIKLIIYGFISQYGGHKTDMTDQIPCFCNWLSDYLTTTNDDGTILVNVRVSNMVTELQPLPNVDGGNLYYGGRGICVNNDWEVGSDKPLLTITNVTAEGEYNNPICQEPGAKAPPPTHPKLGGGKFRYKKKSKRRKYSKKNKKIFKKRRKSKRKKTKRR